MKIKQKTYFLFFFLFFLIATGIFLFTNGFIRGFAGDMVIIAILYLLIRLLTPLSKYFSLSIVLVFAFLIEFIQLLQLPQKFNLSHNLFINITIGATFDPLDLLAYCIGGLLILTLDFFIIKSMIIEKK
ncbi:MAG: DUF2809 domain-containing protein [Spirochaetes bacterium]|nr:DUF2809 domain-containing protein [Spirochaetota bacterium]